MKIRKDVKHRFSRKWAIPHLAVGVFLIALVLIATLSSFFVTRADYTSMDIGNRLAGPTTKHIMGTDQYGRDIMFRVLVGARYSLMVGIIAVTIGVTLGVPAGCLAAAVEGWKDTFISRIMDIIYGFPPIITAVLVTAILGPGLVNVVIAIGLFNVPIFTRISRGNFLHVKENDFVDAARATGRSELKIVISHILPNISTPIIIQVSSQFAFAVLSEAALSYLGLGIQPPNPSWGLMLSQAQSFIRLSPWPVIFPGLAIVLTVLGFNLTGDGLRDLFDPTR